MERFQATMERFLLPMAKRLTKSKILKAVSGGFAMLMPVIMVGAIASLLAGLSIAPYQDAISAAGIKPIFTYVTGYTTNMLALYASFSIAYAMAEQLGCKKHAKLVGLTTLLIFLLLIPTGVAGADGKIVAAALDTTYLGSAGLFTALILGVVVPLIYSMFIKKNVTIKMPDGVPPFIADGFAAIIPALCLTVLFCVFRQLCTLTPYGSFDAMIYGLLRAPLSTLSESPVTFAILVLLCNLLWFFGIHGGMVTMPFITMLYMQPALENLDAFAAGTAVMPNMLTNTWWFTFVQLGGSGGIIGLSICMLFIAQSDRYRTLGKMAIIPALCGISEPVVFGVPLMLNVFMFIPMILTPLLSFFLSYGLSIAGILPYLNGMQLQTGTPVLLSGILTGGVVAMIWQIVLVAIQVAVYLPFFRICDKQAYEEEMAVQQKGAAQPTEASA